MPSKEEDAEPMVAKLREAVKRVRKRDIEDAVSFAVAHGTRVDILCYLNEGQRSPSELSDLMSLPMSRIEHHIKELLASCSIELARVAQVRNTTEHFYRAVEIPFYTNDEMRAMPFEIRQEIYGLILQASTAESLAALRAGKISDDPLTWLSWKWFNLDAQGRKEMAEEDARTWERRLAIETGALERLEQAGDEASTVVVSLLSHERCRSWKGDGPPRSDQA
jgi:DNA-binding transcriptional ArsR family regulator